MLKYLAKISMDIFPSVLATIIGAYIVNHYINARPAADTPAAVVTPADGGKKPADVANLPGPGVKAKGVSEKSISDKGAADKPAAEKSAEPKSAEPKSAEPKSAEPKAADAKAADVARTPAHEKAVAKSAPAAPVVEANSAPVAASPAATPDANDLARAAIERLRKSPEGKATEAKSSEIKPAEAKAVERTPEPTAQEASRIPEAPRVVTAVPSTVRPLPPPINVSTPSPEAYGNTGSSQATPPYTASISTDNPNRLTPPADIPVPVIAAPPLDLRADAGAPMPRPKTNVADEMLSGMKSMFHAVLPKSATPD
ncbi:hypothetical protein [Bradyrhizobium sp. BR13661]|jgi:hypothetical protein|uniref:hypothetical protein n=1 Tax=Bradyrhizobium sp. BR13661 TaxID=2940622 RepID=UPI0024746867|nr:hypothetical protein [Bradyrhizobium sp. BR13661]MDH6256337.1 chemotaxis protein histidine kinase CheA [Bradyrhizobium sp. BR13661]